MEIPKRKICHYGRCAYPATYGFKSENNRIQDQQYCHKHAREVRDMGVFPRCKMIKLFEFSLSLEANPSSKEETLLKNADKELGKGNPKYLDLIKPLIKN